MFLVPQGAKLCRTSVSQKNYQYCLFTSYVVSILWFTLINRLGLDVSRTRWEPFYVVRLLANCYFGFKKIPAYVCKNALKNSKNLLDSVHATPIEDLALNIILFMPLGFLLPWIWPKLNMWKTVLIGFCFSSMIEVTQYLAHWGCLGIDDIFNNTLGTAVGYVCWRMYYKLSQLKK